MQREPAYENTSSKVAVVVGVLRSPRIGLRVAVNLETRHRG
jgi:hypothetical protein